MSKTNKNKKQEEIVEKDNNVIVTDKPTSDGVEIVEEQTEVAAEGVASVKVEKKAKLTESGDKEPKSILGYVIDIEAKVSEKYATAKVGPTSKLVGISLEPVTDLEKLFAEATTLEVTLGRDLGEGKPSIYIL